MKILRVFVLFAPLSAAWPQALISDHIPDYRWPGSNAPGYRFNEGRTLIENNYSFEIRFRLDSSKFATSQGYSCGYPVPEGYWLYDRYSNSGNASAWAVAVGGNRTLCYWDAPASVQFQDLSLDSCHILTAVRSGGTLKVTLDGITKMVTGGGGTYRSGTNGIGIGREINGYSNWTDYDSFPGEISYVEDNGRVVDFQSDGSVSGGAYIGAAVCATDEPKPEPEPQPEPTACDIDPNSVECACEVDPHPACTMCMAQ